jgi:multiple sugar transport system permease protein
MSPMRPPSGSAAATGFQVFRLIVLLVGAAVMLAPFVWMIATSLKPQSEIFSASLRLLPEHPMGRQNYAKALTAIPLLTFLVNGAIVCLAILICQIVFAIPCAYALAKLRFRGRETVFALVLAGLLLPIHATALPLYTVFADLGLLNTRAALIAPFTLSVFAIFMFRQSFKSLPDDLIDAARLDGMHDGTIVWRVVVPNAWPAITAFAVFSVVAHWNDLFWPLIVITNTALATPPLGLLFFRAAEAGDDYGALMAATVVVEGIATTGLKG